LEKNRFKPVWYGFSGLARFFSGFGLVFFGLARLCSGFFYGLGSVRFNFFQFQTYKTETELVSFLKILIVLIGFFYGLGSVRFNFFQFQTYKTETELVSFLKILIVLSV
jgi:hypothetical protein